jgi:ArsR family transcriptional regulator, arsenate/arsenite/antimonite-responsive transcriptional repressor
MAVNKKYEFADKEIRIADWAKALSHPARVAIMKELAKHNSCVCGEIVEVLPLAQSTVSQHLKELKAVGLIEGTIDGAKSCYCINYKQLKVVKETFHLLFESLLKNEKKNCC